MMTRITERREMCEGASREQVISSVGVSAERVWPVSLPGPAHCAPVIAVLVSSVSQVR